MEIKVLKCQLAPTAPEYIEELDPALYEDLGGGCYYMKTPIILFTKPLEEGDTGKAFARLAELRNADKP